MTVWEMLIVVTGGTAAGTDVAPMGELPRVLDMAGKEVMLIGELMEAVTTLAEEVPGEAGAGLEGPEAGTTLAEEISEEAGSGLEGPEAGTTPAEEILEEAGCGLGAPAVGAEFVTGAAGVGTRVIVFGTLVIIPGFWLTCGAQIPAR